MHHGPLLTSSWLSLIFSLPRPSLFDRSEVLRGFMSCNTLNEAPVPTCHAIAFLVYSKRVPELVMLHRIGSTTRPPPSPFFVLRTRPALKSRLESFLLQPIHGIFETSDTPGKSPSLELVPNTINPVAGCSMSM